MIEVYLTLQNLNADGNYELKTKQHHVFIAVNGGQQYILFKEGDDTQRIFIDEKTGKVVANQSNVKRWVLPDESRNEKLVSLQSKLDAIQKEINCIRRGD